MALDSTELVQYARDAAGRGDDLYALLNVDATTPKEDIHRAWRRAGLKYHPDKAGADYDPAKYESFERARDVLVDPAAREAYDNGLKAVLQKRKRVEEMSGERRRFVEELERAEREAKRARTGEREAVGLSTAEKQRAAEAGRRRMEERARLMREAEERSRMREKGQEAPATPAATTAAPGAGAVPDVAATTEDRASVDEPAAAIPSANGDEYEDRIAELERKLKEKRSRKAAKKAGRKSDVSGLSTRWSPSAEEDATTKPPDGEKADSQADGEKDNPDRARPAKSATSSFAFRPPYAASAPTSPAVGRQTASGPGSGSTPSFASTMARLKAAQMKRDEEKRRREAEAAAAAASAAPAGEQQAV